MCARPGNKRYGIPSVVFQLYGAVKMEFKIPPSVFYPVPKVSAAHDIAYSYVYSALYIHIHTYIHTYIHT